MKPRSNTVGFLFGGLWLVAMGSSFLLLCTAPVYKRQLIVFLILAYLSGWGLYFFFSSRSRLGKAARFMISSLALVACLGVLESAAFFGFVEYRLLFQTRMLPWEDPRNVLDEDLLHIHRPHLRFRARYEGGDLSRSRGAEPTLMKEHELAYDRNGFRNAQDLERADIVLLGDSFVEANTVDMRERIGDRLQQLVGQTVANLGQHWYGPDQELEVLMRFGLALQPRLCIWTFFEGNDLNDIWRYRKARRDWQQIVDRYHSPVARSFLFNLTGWLTSPLKRRTPEDEYSGLLRKRDSDPTRLWFGYPGKELNRRDREALTRFSSILDRAAEICRHHSIRLLLVFIPSKFRVYGDLCEFSPSSEPYAWTVNELPREIDNLAQKVAVDYLDLTEPFRRKAAQRDQLLYYADDSHWSPTGHERAAREIGRSLGQVHP